MRRKSAMTWSLSVLPALLLLLLCVDTALLTDCNFEAYLPGPAGFARAAGRRAMPLGAGSRRMTDSSVVETPNKNEIQDVMRAWWTLKQLLPLRYLGVTILMTFLKLYPEYFTLFPDVEKDSVELLPHNKNFVAKSVSFAYDISSIVDNLNDKGLVETMAQKLGRRRQKEGVSKEAFNDMRNLILHLLGRYHKRYAQHFPLGIVESSTRTLNWIFSLMKSGLEMERRLRRDL